MSRLLPLLLLLGACSGGAANRNAAETRPEPANAIAPEAVPAAQNAADPAIADADPGLAEMSPSRRRAYEQGFRDCSAGRYNPDPYPEAYRIGCGAAQERKGR